jgi:hypothetical protein
MGYLATVQVMAGLYSGRELILLLACENGVVAGIGGVLATGGGALSESWLEEKDPKQKP